MRTISVFDTSMLSYNIGNEIIMDAVIRHLDSLFPSDFIIRMPIDDIGRVARRYNSVSELSFVGGTNAMNGNLRKYRQWDLNLHNIYILKNVVLMGCGWFQYEDFKITKFSKWAYSRVLSDNFIHSVRDSYTLNKCLNMGITNKHFINTGCPTLWNLSPNHIASIPTDKSNSVIFTITDYNTVPTRDRFIIETLKRNYQKIYFFPQGRGDIKYLSSLNLLDGIEILPPRLIAFDSMLVSERSDYVGTRLHAGIRALQKKCRSFIIGIDNRAIEMHKDFNLPVISEEAISNLDICINNSYNVELSIPWDNIQIWKQQFKNN